MKTNKNSINDNNGCSTCSNGAEKYTKCVLGAFKGKEYYQYDYRHTDGELFSCVKPTLKECRKMRDEWLQKKEKLFIKDITGSQIEVTDLEKAIQQCKFCLDSPFKMESGHTVGQNHAYMLEQLQKIQQ